MRKIANKVKFTSLIVSGLIMGVLCLGGLCFSMKTVPPKTSHLIKHLKKVSKNKSASTNLPRIKFVHENVLAGWTINDYLKKYGLNPSQIYNIVKGTNKVYNFARIKSGHEIDFYLSNHDILNGFRYEIDKNSYVYVEKKGTAWKSWKEIIPYTYQLTFIQGRIHDNLFNDMKKSGGSAALAIQVSEIFAWDVDFYADLRPGDSFKVLYLKRYINGKDEGEGPIVAAEFVNRGHTYQAIRFTYPDGHNDYFTLDGKSLRKELLKSPLKVGHITSRFSYHRFHPVLKIYRPHFGVDIAAPIGTPVHAAGEGVVVYKGRKGEAGKMIEIRHANGYSTQYLHLSRYANGIRKGVRVHQGQVIAYVGRTGVATGPHLDYRIKYRGRYVNPLKQRFKRANPLSEKYLSEFSKYAMISSKVFCFDGKLRQYYMVRLNKLISDKRNGIFANSNGDWLYPTQEATIRKSR